MDPSRLSTALGALLLVLGLVWGGARALRRAGLARPGAGRLAIRESLALDRTRRLHLVACDGRELLLLTGGGADAVVAWLTPRDAGDDLGNSASRLQS